MCEVKEEGCCKAKEQSRKVIDFGVTKTVITLHLLTA